MEVVGGALLYARALTALEQLRGARPMFGMGSDGPVLKDRIHRLLGLPLASTPRPPTWLLAMATLVAMAWLASGIGLPWKRQVGPNQGASAKLRRLVPVAVAQDWSEEVSGCEEGGTMPPDDAQVAQAVKDALTLIQQQLLVLSVGPAAGSMIRAGLPTVPLQAVMALMPTGMQNPPPWRTVVRAAREFAQATSLALVP